MDDDEVMISNTITCEEPLYDDEIMEQIVVEDEDCSGEEAGVPLDPAAVHSAMASELQECKKLGSSASTGKWRTTPATS